MSHADDALKETLIRRGFQCIETHLSRVYLRGDDVYKTKRDVRFAFVDFSRAEARLAACHAEVLLNQRLAPDVYLGVVAIVPDDKSGVRFVSAAELPFGATEQSPLAWAVHMRRLPEHARADVLLASEQLGADEVIAIARMLSHFHAGCRSTPETAKFGSETVVRGNVEENFRELAPFIASYLNADESTRLETAQRTWLKRRGALLARRAREGFARDGHGDLRLEHVYRRADGGFIAIDCIEFSDRFRFADVALDVAFLAMDFHLHGRPDFAELLLAEYARESFDYALYGAIDFYISYRAVVRAKVSAFLAADAAVAQATRERARDQAERAFALAQTCLSGDAQKPILILCVGLMASGKSSLARALGVRLSVPVVSADRVRKHLLHADPLEPHHEAPFRGSYSDQVTEQVYETLRQHAAGILASSRSAILDATFRARSERSEALALAEELGVPVLVFECAVPRDVSMARLEERSRAASESDGRPEIFDAVARMYQPLDELPESVHVRVDTTLPLAENVASCGARIRAAIAAYDYREERSRA